MYRILVVETGEYLYYLSFMSSIVLCSKYEIDRFKLSSKIYEAKSLDEAKNMLRLTLVSTSLHISEVLEINELPNKNFNYHFKQIESIFEFVKV